MRSCGGSAANRLAGLQVNAKFAGHSNLLRIYRRNHRRALWIGGSGLLANELVGSQIFDPTSANFHDRHGIYFGLSGRGSQGKRNRLWNRNRMSVCRCPHVHVFVGVFISSSADSLLEIDMSSGSLVLLGMFSFFGGTHGSGGTGRSSCEGSIFSSRG